MDMDRVADAGLSQRLAALALDGLMALVLFAAANLLLYKSGILAAAAVSEEANPLAAWLRPALLLTLVVAAGAGVALCWHCFAGTPGARLMGLMLVRGRDGEGAGWVRVLTRVLVAVALGGLGILWSFRGRSALHDRLSGTRLVVEDERLVRLPRAAGGLS